MGTAKDMYKAYSGTSTVDLIKNLNRKKAQLWKLGDLNGYWVKKERARLQAMITQLEAVLEARRLQEPLF